jgi:hypothetical protein
VCGIDDQDIDSFFDQRSCSLQRFRPDSDGSTDPQSSVGILGRVRILDPLLDVLDRDQPFENPALVDDRKLLDLVLVEDLAGFVERRSPPAP